MKLPRWLLVLMLAASSLAILAVAGWWWVTWPERTARKFVAFLETEDMAAANAMIDSRNRVTVSLSPDFISIDGERFGTTASKTLIIREFQQRAARGRGLRDYTTARMIFDSGRFVLRAEMNKVLISHYREPSK